MLPVLGFACRCRAPAAHSPAWPLDAAAQTQVNLRAPTATVIAEVIPVLVSGRWQPLVGLAVADTARLVAVRGRGLQVRTLSK